MPVDIMLNKFFKSIHTYLRLINFGVKRDGEGQEQNQNYDEKVNWREDLLKNQSAKMINK